MKRQFKLHLMGILILVFCVSCGQSVKETIKPVVPGAASDQFERVAIVPFADHTPASSLTDHCRRNTLVTEALQSGLLINVTAERVVRLLPPLIMDQLAADQLVERLSPMIRAFVDDKYAAAAGGHR